MRIGFLNKKNSTIFGLIIIIIGIVITTILVRKGVIFEIGAGPTKDPKNVEITNISDISFTVSYITDSKVIGTLKYGKNPSSLENIVLDDRDQISQSINKYNVHSITVKNLDPETKYYFMINSADVEFSNNDKPWEIKTGSAIIDLPSSQKPISGKIIKEDGQPPNEGLVYVSIHGGSKVSSLIRDDGTYIIPLNNLRTQDQNNYFEFNEDSLINIEIFSENLYSSITINLDQISPVPLITLSKNYDFSDNEPVPSGSQGGGDDNLYPSFDSIKKSVSITPAPVFSPTPSQTLILNPTSIPSKTPTPQITVEMTRVLTPSPTIPEAGNSSVIITGVLGGTAVIIGIILFLFTRGQISL